jgi:hypothetical protein
MIKAAGPKVLERSFESIIICNKGSSVAQAKSLASIKKAKRLVRGKGSKIALPLLMNSVTTVAL